MNVLCAYILTSLFGEQSTNSGIFNVTTCEMQSLESLHAVLIEKILNARQWDKTEAERITVVNIQTEKSLLCKSTEGEVSEDLAEENFIFEDWAYDDSPDIAERVVEAFKSSKKLTVLGNAKNDTGFIIVGDGTNAVLDKAQADALLEFINSASFPK